MVKYIYIDDEDESAAVRDGLNDVGIISVHLEKPRAFEMQSEDLLAKLKEYNGVILDLRLDDHPQSDARYTASPLAQALRSFSSINNGKGDSPIILCSTDAKIRKSYVSDQSSHDLFDYKFLKDHEPNWQKIALKLNSLALGYSEIAKWDGEMSAIIERNTGELDNRIFERFNTEETKFPPHEYARFIIKDILGQPGPLINEKLLAARLGIDFAESPGWERLLAEFFFPALYQGVFSDGWKRWWSDKVIEIFKSLTKKRLSTLKASERVDALVKATSIENLTSAQLLPRCVSTNFSTICEYYKKPLDPLEGFKILTTRELKPWQEPRYISIDAAVERRGYGIGLMVHPSETERVERIKQLLKEQGQ